MINVITNTPKKLQISASNKALLGLIDLVEIAVAIVFGASVHPLTNITAEIKIVINRKLGFSISFAKKSKNEIVIFFYHLL